MISSQLIETPEKSNRQIAEGLGVSHHTVQAVRGEAEATGQIAQLDKTVGADGKERRKPIRTEFRDPSPETTAGVPRKDIKPASSPQCRQAPG